MVDESQAPLIEPQYSSDQHQVDKSPGRQLSASVLSEIYTGLIHHRSTLTAALTIILHYIRHHPPNSNCLVMPCHAIKLPPKREDT